MAKNKKVALLGKLPTKFKAPFDDLTYDIWTLNRHEDENRFKRITEWFDIHNGYHNPKATITRSNYPFKEVETLLGGNFFNNTVSYMIAYAILKGYVQIDLYGMRFQSADEQRRREYHNVRELIFFARGQGVKVSAPYDPIMLQTYEYYGV
ncbi:MAG: hypothetical protein II306_06565 [Clostridia bacterium]|nr:hypothetical protein [Clostridia bacterium]